MNFLQNISHFIAAFGLIATSFLSQHHTTISSHVTNPTASMENSTSGDVYTANKSITYNGYSVNISLVIPQNGGVISGTVSGDCNGKITGKYDGQNNGVMNSQSNVNCSLLFVQIPGTATFNGTLNKENKTASGQVSVGIDSFQKTEPVTITFN